MGRVKNDGRGRLGGRAKGTPNNPPTKIDVWVSELLDSKRKRFVECMGKLEPQEYVKVYMRLLNYVAPKIAPKKPKIEGGGLQEFLNRVNGYRDDD